MTNLQEQILDVTILAPNLKHSTIIEYFDNLEENESLTIHNDHDPKPLYYQLIAERGNIFNWNYIEQGPSDWKVKITKQKTKMQEETIEQIAAKDYKKIAVFKKYGIDFCCGGNKTLPEICLENGIDKDELSRDLDQAQMEGLAHNFNDWSLDKLADYISETHHGYIRKVLPEICSLAQKVKSLHANRHPRLIRICELLEAITKEMNVHLVKEERILFPYIKALISKNIESLLIQNKHFGSLQDPINFLEMEHEFHDNYWAEIRKLTNGYSLPSDACASYQNLYNMLEDFENNLHQHHHLENNILFKKAIDLELALKQ